MKASKPIEVAIPAYGVLFAESVHAMDFRMDERMDPFNKLVYVLDGRVSYHEPSSGAGYIAESGSLIAVARGIRHRFEDVRTSTLLLLCLAENFLGSDPELSRLWAELTGTPGRRLFVSKPGRVRIERIWRHAMLERAVDRIGAGVAVRALAAQLLVLSARLPGRGAGDSAAQRVSVVAQEVDETFFEEWSLDRAASRAGLSRRRFSELFRDLKGRAFGEYLTGLRLTHAARLLQAGEHSIMGVMFSCGFNDVTHFYRIFRGRYGAPPRTWQAGRRAPR